LLFCGGVFSLLICRGVLAGCFVDLFFICCFAEGFCRWVFYLLVCMGVLQKAFFIYILRRGFLIVVLQRGFLIVDLQRGFGGLFCRFFFDWCFA